MNSHGPVDKPCKIKQKATSKGGVSLRFSNYFFENPSIYFCLICVLNSLLIKDRFGCCGADYHKIGQ